MKKLFYTIAFCFFISYSGYAQSITLILRDPDMKAPTNVRAKPGGDIVKTIDGREVDYELEIIGKEGNYFIVKSYVSCEMEEPITLNKPGYIHYSVLGTVISNYAKKAFPVYASSSKGTPLKKLMISEEFVNVLDMTGDMYYVFSKRLNLKFWVESKYICSAVCTTCS